ncbi:metallophosphoesterase family protein [Shouchella lehensis]|uniref:Serine/threonine protein phosphatase n=1 Tax=Shouchella lehensis TaxID=300825 RepID=A0A4Y7WES6_9BACI|nr:metallophosphoesterase family protein [Shouchella lehensis]TES46276.1 serine/threonine protein phosphatase [Shouchella lehensis]
MVRIDFCYNEKKKDGFYLKNVFVVGDIHGCFDELIELLQHWDKTEEQLIFLGDYIDRGKDSRKVLEFIQNLVQKDGAIALKGNHELMFIDWLNEWQSDRFVRNGGKETIYSLLGTDTEIDERRAVAEAYPQTLHFLKNLPLYYEWGNYLFVHAGINPTLSNWKQNTEHDFLWIRDDFHFQTNPTNKVIIFGHTPVQMLHPEPISQPWISPCATKIGMDGGLVFGGKLFGLRISSDGTRKWFEQQKHE